MDVPRPHDVVDVGSGSSIMGTTMPDCARAHEGGPGRLQGLERLVSVVQDLSLARTLAAVMQTVRRAARELTGADGATFVLRDGDFCHYADEYAIAPLWKGRRFPLDQCISGWTMIHGQPVVIEDIYADPRIPAEAYRPTFVKSLVMVPIRTVAPVGAIGNYWAHQHKASPEEVKLLGALADSTSIAMENVGLYAMLERRVQERTAALAHSQAELTAKNAALVRAQQQKEELAALLVHDLKSPASGILMTCRARLRSADLGEPERRSWKLVEAAAEVINRLALNILDVSRSDDGAFVAKIEPLDPRLLLVEVVELMTPLAEERGQTLTLEVDLDRLDADGELLRRVLQNLIDNAVRYSPRGTTIRLQARSSGDGMAEIRVIDEGRGIPHVLRQRIFEKYARIEGGVGAQDTTGRGLGLAFCRLAAQGHGGEISLEDNQPQGNVFTVRLPIRPRDRGRGVASATG